MSKSERNRNINELVKLIQSNYKKNVESMSVEELVKLLKKLSDVYYNTGNSLVSDAVYDYLRDILEERDSEHPFLSEVGAPVKGTLKKVTLPYDMGSLRKKKPGSGDIDRWISEFKGPFILSDKLDGCSAQLYKDKNGDLFMYSRGQKGKGSDISHLIKYFFNDDILEKIPKNMSIRGELIMSKKNFKKVSSYLKNARNAVAGLITSKTVDVKVAKITEFIAYAILHPRYSQENQMKILEKMGFTCVIYKKVSKLNDDILSDYLINRREKSEYEMDGIVCVDDSKIYKHDGGYVDHMFAFKMMFDDQIAQTTVVKVIWTPSMDGYLKPRIEIEPIDLVGTTVTFATAYNAKFIVDNKIGPGSIVKIIRSGDVIPKIEEVVKSSKNGKPQLPDEYEYDWNDTEVDFVLTNEEDNDIVKIRLITYFFKTIGVKYLSEGIVTKLVENEYDSIESILSADHRELENIDGLGEKMIKKIFDEIARSFEQVDLATFMAASHKFGRGLAEKKLREVIDMYPNIMNENWKHDKMIKNILEVTGFSNKLAELFTDNFKNFKTFYTNISKIMDISRFEDEVSESDNSDEENKIFSDKSIVFTGFRDKELEKNIIKMGGKVSGSVSGKTFIVIYADGADKSTGKLKKASESGVKIMSKSEFIKKYM